MLQFGRKNSAPAVVVNPGGMKDTPLTARLRAEAEALFHEAARILPPPLGSLSGRLLTGLSPKHLIEAADAVRGLAIKLEAIRSEYDPVTGDKR
jgi:hypothetical protein